MKKTITYKEAFKIYLDDNWENIMPFDDSHEQTFIQYLEGLGYTILKEKDIQEQHESLDN